MKFRYVFRRYGFETQVAFGDNAILQEFTETKAYASDMLFVGNKYRFPTGEIMRIFEIITDGTTFETIVSGYSVTK